MLRLLTMLALLSFSTSCSKPSTASRPVVGATVGAEEHVVELDGYTLSQLTFQGNASDILIAYAESNITSEVELYNSSGESVGVGKSYPSDIVLSEYEGEHGAVMLPATDEYRLTVKTRTSALENGDHELVFRIASDYEEAMIGVASLREAGEEESAYTLLGEIIEQYPDLPQPYVWRATVQFELVREDSDLSGLMEESLLPIADALYAKYSSAPADRQVTLISDLRLSAEKLEDMDGDFKLEIPYNPEFSIALADYFETGEAPSLLRF